LLLAGDVGQLIDQGFYLRFLQTHAPRYERIFLVLGNHEFYGATYEAGITAAQRLCSDESLQDKVTLLHRGR
jgi:hypothetical protein